MGHPPLGVLGPAGPARTGPVVEKMITNFSFSCRIFLHDPACPRILNVLLLGHAGVLAETKPTQCNIRGVFRGGWLCLGQFGQEHHDSIVQRGAIFLQKKELQKKCFKIALLSTPGAVLAGPFGPRIPQGAAPWDLDSGPASRGARGGPKSFSCFFGPNSQSKSVNMNTNKNKNRKSETTFGL